LAGEIRIGPKPGRLPHVHHEAVDGEVAAQHVGLRIGFKVHGGGPAAVLIFVVAAEGGDFHLREGVAHQNHAEVRADQAGVGEQVLMRSGRASVEMSKSLGLARAANRARNRRRARPGARRSAAVR